MRRIAAHTLAASLCWFAGLFGGGYLLQRTPHPVAQSIVEPVPTVAGPEVRASAPVLPSGLTHEQASAFHDELDQFVDANREQNMRAVSAQLSGVIGFVFPWQAHRDLAKQLRAARARHVIEFEPTGIQISTANLGRPIEERCWEIHGCMTVRARGKDEQLQGGVFAYYDGRAWRFSSFYVMKNGVTGRPFRCGERIGDWGQPN